MIKKLYKLGYIFIFINIFENLGATSQRLTQRSLWQNRSIKKTETFMEIVRKTNYPVEERFVTTSDGYVLSVHRIFGGPKSPPARGKPLVLLIHGLAASTDIWVMRGPEKDVAYLLANEGYDVWLLNIRGNFYSRKNIRLSPNSAEFWEFSWHENGVYDLPATIDYMIAQTGVSKVTLIGHSMGTTISYVLLTVRPEYNEKIDLVISFAPVAIPTRQYRGPALTIGLPLGKEATMSLRRRGVNELFPHAEFGPQLIADFCSPPGIRNLCRDIIFLISGSVDREQFDDTLLPTLLVHYPSGTSLKTIEHYRQNLVNESFRYFDYDVNENYARYGSTYPPEYPVEKITAPVLIYYGLNDPLAQPADIKALEKRLPNVVASKSVPFPLFNHFDFVISKDSKKLLYDDVISYIKQFKAKKK